MGRAKRSERGTVYVLVLGIVSLLVVMAVGGAMLARGAVERGNLEEDQAHARQLAESYLAIIHKRITGTTTWRSTHLNNTWTNPGELIAGCKLQYKLVDEDDANLSDLSTEPVRLYAKAVDGDAARVYSVELIPGESDTLTVNPKSFRQETAD